MENLNERAFETIEMHELISTYTRSDSLKKLIVIVKFF